MTLQQLNDYKRTLCDPLSKQKIHFWVYRNLVCKRNCNVLWIGAGLHCMKCIILILYFPISCRGQQDTLIFLFLLEVDSISS